MNIQTNNEYLNHQVLIVDSGTNINEMVELMLEIGFQFDNIISANSAVSAFKKMEVYKDITTILASNKIMFMNFSNFVNKLKTKYPDITILPVLSNTEHLSEIDIDLFKKSYPNFINWPISKENVTLVIQNLIAG